MFGRTIDGDIGEIGGAAAWARNLASEAGLSADVIYAVELGLEEALANLIIHGRADGEGRRAIGLAFSAEAGAARVEVSDRRRPFDVARAPVPAGPAPGDMAGGGQGLRLLHAFAAELAYRSDADGNRLTMVFRPAPPAAGPA